MKKDIEWLKERVFSRKKSSELNVMAHREGLSEDFESRVIAYESVLKLINQLDEPEKVVVPKFVADWMEENSTGRYSWWKKIAEWESEVPDKDRKVYDWYTQSNEDTFIIAWITSHYEIEEEPLYYVMKDGVVILSRIDEYHQLDKSRWIGAVTNKEYIKENPDKVRFTEQEIKDYDERFWAFAVPVDEGENKCH